MNLISKVFKAILWPVCRMYGRYIVKDMPADSIYRALCSLQFLQVHRYWPNFVIPKSFNEKLWSCMLHNRDPILTLISDKLRVREYVEKKIGNSYLIPLLWQGPDPKKIPFAKLPLKFVLKTNHGCGYVIVVDDKNKIDQKEVRLQLKKWLKTNFGMDTYLGIAWGYKKINPTIIVEAKIEEKEKVPVDYKFYCFNGQVEFLTIHYDRFEDHKTRSFDKNFDPYDFRYDFDCWKGECGRPKNFDAMVCIAETLASDFDFIRVDLYNTGGVIFFSELTPYPGGVSTRFLPLSRDYILGEKWKVNKRSLFPGSR
jgi:hypothetical protein